MKFLLTLLFAIYMSAALVAGQGFFYNQFPGNVVRDPRQNRGPVVFPPSPPDAVDETSGVVVGASGYGFVPPQQNDAYYSTTLESPALSYTTFGYYSNPYTQRLSFFY